MKDHELKHLASIHYALGEMLASTSASDSSSRAQTVGDIRGESPKQSEIDREMQRLVRANDAMRSAAELLWNRTNTVVFPPAPVGENANGKAVESCGSQLGSFIQGQALQVESTAANLRYLADSLAV